MNKSGRTASSTKRSKCKEGTIVSGLSQFNHIGIKIEHQISLGSSSINRPFSPVSLPAITSLTTVLSIWLLQALHREGYLPTYLLKNMPQRNTTMKPWMMIWIGVWMNVTNLSTESTRTLSTLTATWETKTQESTAMIPKTIINQDTTPLILTFTIKDRIQESAEALITIYLWQVWRVVSFLELIQMLGETKWWTFICKKHVKNKFFTSPRQGTAATIP